MLKVLLFALMSILFTFQSSTTKLYTQSYAGPSKGDASVTYSMFYGFVTAFMTFLVNGFAFSPCLATVLLGLLNAFMLILYTTSLVNASAQGPYTFLMMCALTGSILIPLGYNLLFMGERLTVLQLGGIALLLVSFALMNLRGMPFAGAKPPRSYFFWCAALFVANGAYGQIMNIQQSLTGGAERSEMIICTYFLMALFVLIWRLIRAPQAVLPGFRMGRKAFVYALLCCAICTAATNLLVYLLTVLESATVLFALNNGAVLLLSGLLAIFLFHEKADKYQTAGLVFACAGIVVLSI